LLVPHDRERIGIREPVAVVRPLLTSITVIAASAALSLVAIMDDARGIAGGQATVILMLLGTAIALRILINQLASAEAYTSLRAAVAESDASLRDMDAALERVREANESLTTSEEHLRLVFEAAVDGFVEVDHEGTIVRANDAFARMISTDAGALTGLPWAALAGVVDGADTGFGLLLNGAHATLERSDGQVMHLESTASPTRRSGRCSTSCRTAMRTAPGYSAAPTPRSSRSGTGSRATCMTVPCKASPLPRSAWRRLCS
jgi:PAS domain-containing protein